MPASDNNQMQRSNRIRKDNLAKIAKIRASGNARLIQLVDEMEETMTERLGEEGYMQFLESAPLETLLKRFVASRKGKSNKSQTKSPKGQITKATPSAPTADTEERHFDYRYSTDVEQELLDERRGANAIRRPEIDAELDAIHASRLSHIAHNRPFDEFTAEKALEKHRRDRESNPMSHGDPMRDEPSAGTSVGGSPAIGIPSPTNDRNSAVNDGDFNPNRMRSSTGDGMPDSDSLSADDFSYGNGTYAASSAGPDEVIGTTGSVSRPASSSTGSVPASSGGISISGAPTSGAEAPNLSTGMAPESSAVTGQPEEDMRGMLDDSEDERGNLSGGSDLQDDAEQALNSAKEAADDATKKQADQRRKMLLRVLLPVLMHALPILLVVVALLMLAQCIDNLNPFHTSGGSSNGGTASSAVTGTEATGTRATGASGDVTRQSQGSGLPRVKVDPRLADLFADEDGEEADEGNGNACVDYPYVATFFGSDDDWTDTLYASDDCVNFRAIGTVPNEMRDPCIMLRNGRYWVVTCLNDEDGHVWLNVSSSEDLKTWVGPTLNGPFDLDRLPYCNGYGTSNNYNVVAPEWFLDEDNSVHVIISCGHWGACHGNNWDDWMEAYMLDVDELKLSGNENKLTAKGPLHWMDVNANYDDRIDGTIDYVNGMYYLTIKRHGLNMELWRNTSCSPSGWTRLHDCFLYGYEAPCLFPDHQGTWHILGDGCPDVRPFGTKMWTASSIDGDWSPAEVHFFRQDGSEVPLVRHGTVLPVEGATGQSGGSQSDGTLNSKQKAVVDTCKRVGSPGGGLCALWVGDVYEAANVGVTFRGHAYDWYYGCCGSSHGGGTVKTDPKRFTLKPGMTIAVPSTGVGLGATYGHVGIYVGGGKVMHNIGSIDTCSVDDWISTYGKVTDVGWGYPAGMG